MKAINRWICAAAVALIIASVAAMFFLGHTTVTGTPTANRDIVVAVAAEREATAARQAAAEEANLLSQLEDETRRSMQGYFGDPANGLNNYGLVVLSVGLIKSAGNQYEGMATISRNGGSPRDIAVHVTADDRRSMWSTDPGALVPLFQ